MKKLPLFVVTLGVLVFASTTVVAGGAGCDKSKGHSKELSAEGMKEHGKNHTWLFSDDHPATNDALISENAPAQESSEAGKKDLIEI